VQPDFSMGKGEEAARRLHLRIVFLSMVVGILYLTTQCSGQGVVGLTLPVGNRLVKATKLW
jgi:hypothetical protein